MSWTARTNRSLTPVLRRYAFPAGVTAFSTQRQGGTSEGSYATFNINTYCGDRPEHIARNRRALVRLLGIKDERLVMPHQVHGNRVLMVDEELMRAPEADRRFMLEGVDALITRLRGVCIAVSTADCVPLLLYDPAHGAVAAIHSGWRGTVQAIATHTVQAMQQAYGTRPADLVAAIGPHIGTEAFEVGQEVVQEFERAGFPLPRLVHQTAGAKPHIDLTEANRWLLTEAGVDPANVADAGICSYTDVAHYFSARRLGLHSGRTLTGIMLEAEG